MSETSFTFLFLLSVAYLLPSVIAMLRGHHNALAIFLLNLLLGWTALGWLGAFIWSATWVRPKDAAYY